MINDSAKGGSLKQAIDGQIVSPREVARRYAFSNRTELANDLISWWDTGILPEDGKFHELAKLCDSYTVRGEGYIEAERMISKLAVVGLACGEQKE